MKASSYALSIQVTPFAFIVPIYIKIFLSGTVFIENEHREDGFYTTLSCCSSAIFLFIFYTNDKRWIL